jgi:hypothetical protein
VRPAHLRRRPDPCAWRSSRCYSCSYSGTQLTWRSPTCSLRGLARRPGRLIDRAGRVKAGTHRGAGPAPIHLVVLDPREPGRGRCRGARSGLDAVGPVVDDWRGRAGASVAPETSASHPVLGPGAARARRPGAERQGRARMEGCAPARQGRLEDVQKVLLPTATL